ncbi:MAG: hypothetical protein KAT44_13520, partial [Pirellulales bacterium]|nr:hypothetical protein [Pirellulales bacterium]
QSLIVKLQGDDAGLTAYGEGTDILDRIGGTVQVIGQPGYPVVMTSLRDDSIGASLNPLGEPTKDTNTDGAASQASSDDWRGMQFLPLSNDTNVKVVAEEERSYTSTNEINANPVTAQVLGVLAPNFATDNNSTESAQEKSGDENRRTGFEVTGAIAIDDPADVDVYSFTGYAGSEVWIDVDKTSSALDAMVELLDASGTVLARSIDGLFDTQKLTGERSDEITGGSASLEYDLNGQNILPGSLSGTVYRGNTAIQAFSVSRDGVFSFDDIGNPAIKADATSLIDHATGRVTLNFNQDPVVPTSIRDLTFETSRFSVETLGFTGTGDHGGYVKKKDGFRGNDYYSINPRDPGMRVILPGVQGAVSQYFIRVRSQPDVTAATTLNQYETALTDVSPSGLAGGKTSGLYQLRVRLQQRDQKPGSVVSYADIRYPDVGIDVLGLPLNSQLTGEIGEVGTDNNSFGSDQPVGSILESHQTTIS